MSSRLADLFRGRREYLAIQWPGLDVRLKLRVLSHAEIQEAEAAAHERMRGLKIELGTFTHEIYEMETAIQILHRACRDVDDPDRCSFAVDADDLRANAKAEDLATVVQQWKALQSKHNPQGLSEEVWREVEDAAKKKDVARLRACAFGMHETSTPTSDSPQPT